MLLLVCALPSSAQRVQPLWDGKSLAGWEVTPFLTHGPVRVEEGRLLLKRGEPMTGITWRGDFPRIDYEVRLEAMRVEGSDFFSAITFPVHDSHCTLVIGGWGGSVVGLSSIEGADASENETSRWMSFENGRWYTVRLRVTDRAIEAWIDGEMVVDFAHEGRLLSTRVEVLRNRPFGIATWQSTAALRDLELRLHAPAEESLSDTTR